MSLASSAVEHHAAPQALPLVVTWSRVLPSLSELPAGKGASDPSGSPPLAANSSPEQPPAKGPGLPSASLLLAKQERLLRGAGRGSVPARPGGLSPG